MTREKKTIEKALQQKGFKKVSGDHNWFIYYDSAGSKTPVKTKTSHTPKAKTIAGDLFSRMAKQVHLSTEEFGDLVDCPLDQIGYEAILRSKGAI